MVSADVFHVLSCSIKSHTANNESYYKRITCTAEKTNHIQTQINQMYTLTSSVENRVEMYGKWPSKPAVPNTSIKNKNQKQQSNICFPVSSLIQLPSYMIYD